LQSHVLLGKGGENGFRVRGAGVKALSQRCILATPRSARKE
jgi:hypothetical protein